MNTRRTHPRFHCWHAFALLAIFSLATSCSPKIASKLVSTSQPLAYDAPVIVLGLADQPPKTARLLGDLKVGDSGFSTDCSYETVIDAARLEARKAGGNVVKITKHKTPDFLSTCHRITAQVYHVEDIADLLPQEEILTGADYALLHVYRFSNAPLVSYDLRLGDSVLCRVSSNSATTVRLNASGAHTLLAKTETTVERPITIEHGRHYYLRCGIGIGAFVGRPKLELVDYHTGRQEFESISTKNK